MPANQQLRDLANRIPDPDSTGRYANLDQDKVQQIEKVVLELLSRGPDAVLGLIEMLVEAGKGDDMKPRFALHLVAVRVTQPGQEPQREQFSRAVASQLGGDRPKPVQAYLIELLQWAGTKAAGERLGQALLDPELCDAAARALAAIRDGASERLLAALPKVSGPSRRSVIAKLGMLRAEQAAGAFRESLADRDPETRVASAWGIARIADASAAEALLQCASAHAGWERINETDACMALAESLASAGKIPAAAAIYRQLAKTRIDPAEAHVRGAAERGLAKTRTPSG